MYAFPPPLWALVGWKMPMVRSVTFDLCVGLYPGLKWTFSSMGDDLTLRNEDNLGVVIENWHLCFHMAHAALKGHAGCLYPAFYTGRNSRRRQSPPSWGCQVIVCTGISVCEEAVFVAACYWSKLSHM